MELLRALKHLIRSLSSLTLTYLTAYPLKRDAILAKS